MRFAYLTAKPILARRFAAREPQIELENMAGVVGLELTTPGFGDQCSAN